MQSQPAKIHTRRIIVLILATIIIFASGAMRLFDYQVVHGEEFLKSAQKSSFTTVEIEAARGEIVDRFGVPFTKNKADFLVELDYAFLKKGEENKVIYNLIKTFEALDEEYIDNLPITKNQPYRFLKDREVDISKLKKNLYVNSYATAEDCMAALYEKNDKRYAKDPEYKDKGITGIEYLPYTEEYKRKIAGVRYEMIAFGFSGNNPRYTFADGIDADTVAFLRELSADFIGVEVVSKAARTYVGGEVASHLIGKIGLMNEKQLDYYMGLEKSDYKMNDTVGQGGIEEAFEQTLRGKNGQMRVIKNARGDVVDIIETTASEAGKTIALTIDYDFNKELNKIFADFIKNYNETNKEKKVATSGALVVLDAKTGGLLSSTSYPYYDQAEFFEDYNKVAQAENKPMFNRVLQGLYRPGSTFKPVVAAGALAEGVITPQTRIRCDGVYNYFGSTFRPTCLGHGHLGTSPDVSAALKWSCNIFFYDTGRQLNIDRMNEYAHYMGLGTETGLEIANAQGVISNPDFSQKMGALWVPGNVVQAAIGQLDTQVTPLQMAIEAMTIANHGTRYNAHLLQSVYNHDQTKLLEKEKATIASQFNMTQESFNAISDGMIGAGETIMGENNLMDLGYKVAVKTGTPQTNSTEKYNNGFIAFAPVENPQIAIACILEEGADTNLLVKQVLKAYERSKTYKARGETLVNISAQK